MSHTGKNDFILFKSDVPFVSTWEPQRRSLLATLSVGFNFLPPTCLCGVMVTGRPARPAVPLSLSSACELLSVDLRLVAQAAWLYTLLGTESQSAFFLTAQLDAFFPHRTPLSIVYRISLPSLAATRFSFNLSFKREKKN